MANPKRAMDVVCQEILDHLAKQNPEWGTRIEAVQQERGLTATQFVVGCCARLLDEGGHMRVAVYAECAPSREESVKADPREKCQVCGGAMTWTTITIARSAFEPSGIELPSESSVRHCKADPMHTVGDVAMLAAIEKSRSREN